MPALCYSLSRLAAHPEREQQQHESDHREQAEIEEQCRAHERCEPRRAIGAAQLAIHVARHIEHREKKRDLAGRRQDRKSGGWGSSVLGSGSMGGRGTMKKKKKT